MANVMPGKQNLNILIGIDFPFVFVIDIDGTILDLTGATVEAQIRESASRTADVIVPFTVVVANGDQAYLSEITLSLTDTQTAAITQSSGAYDVAVTLGTDTTYYLRGAVNFIKTVTVPV